MAQPPNLNIPSSSSTVRVRIIDTTTKISNMPLVPLIAPVTPGFETLECPAFSFLIEHPTQGLTLFDLGMRKDWENISPVITTLIKQHHVDVSANKNVREILEENGVAGADIRSIIWSHFHYDHTGDPSTFEPHTDLVVGPGFKAAFVPGYPEQPECPVLNSDYAGRSLVEISFSPALQIGRFEAHDYFSDGSFYLLNAPGHSIGHMCGLARVTSNPDSFIFMAADACHHGGELRPSAYLPLPETILPHPLVPDLHEARSKPCPGDIFEHLLRDGDRSKPFYEIARLGPGKSVAFDADEAVETVGKVQEADAQEKVLVVMAHDDGLIGTVDFFPKYADTFAEKGWREEVRWKFLKDLGRGIIFD
jgi:glyoxylase-like metal-dependent hydrolase (beta-lactamase superfamily II)